MSVRVALNGFGRIGRNIFRILYERDDIEVTAICDPATPAHLAYLLQYDSIEGSFREPVELVNGQLCARGRLIPFLNGRKPGDVSWRKYDADIVIECSGRYRSRAELAPHLEAGARRVILTVPPEGKLEDAEALAEGIIIPGLNERSVSAETKILSVGSGAVNALAPVVKVLQEAFGIEEAFYTLVHAYTNEMSLGDVSKLTGVSAAGVSVDDAPHTDLRRSRSAPENIIPASTHSPVRLDALFPELTGRLNGMSVSAAVPDGSVIDLVTFHAGDVSAVEINAVLKSAAATRFNGNLEYTEAPIVSADVTGNPRSGIFDALMTSVITDEGEGGRRSMAKTLTWYDNGWSHAHRVIDLVDRVAETL